MPVYLCQPGAGAAEPWRHGIQVYAAPFALDDGVPSGSGDTVVLTGNSSQWPNDRQQHEPQEGAQREQQQPMEGGLQYLPMDYAATNAATGGSMMGATTAAIVFQQQQRSRLGIPIRRVRHAEVVLVDDVCMAFERYWLRLRWPGHKGGFAGYIALGKVGQGSWFRGTENLARPRGMFLFLTRLKMIDDACRHELT
jgi:hypothetical protein